MKKQEFICSEMTEGERRSIHWLEGERRSCRDLGPWQCGPSPAWAHRWRVCPTRFVSARHEGSRKASAAKQGATQRWRHSTQSPGARRDHPRSSASSPSRPHPRSRG